MIKTTKNNRILQNNTKQWCENQMRHTDTGRELYSSVISMSTVLLDCEDLCGSNRYYNLLQIIYFLLIYFFGEALIYS